MSSNHVFASMARISGVLLLIVSQGALTLIGTASGADLPGSPPQTQPRDPRREARPQTPSREQELQAALNSDPAKVAAWLELAKLQEARGGMDEAEATFKAALSATGGSREVLMAMAAFFNRIGHFPKTMAALEQVAAENPADPVAHHTVAVYYWDKAYRDQALTPADKLMYIEAGISAADRALASKEDYVDALTYKNLLLRLKSNMETDPLRRQELIAEADKLRTLAMELNKVRSGVDPNSPSSGEPPAPPAPSQPIRVGGNIKAPTKVEDVRPVYPQEAVDAGVSGLVVLEIVIDEQGGVRTARVLRSIPLLDQAAIDAVKQWRYTPTLLNGVPVPVIMTVTVNFSTQ